MITRLLWKEFREKRLWILLLVAAVVTPTALGKGFPFCGTGSSEADWLLPSMLISLLFGLAAYSGELGKGTLGFLRSRPVSWKVEVAARLAFGLGAIVAASILGAVAFRLTCPEPYIRFAGLSRLAIGVGEASLAMGSFYILGIITSAVVPGMVGALLTLLALGIASGAEFSIMQRLLPYDDITPYVGIAGWALGAAVASLLVVRFGLTLPVASRIKRYWAVTASIALAVTGLSFALPIWKLGCRPYTAVISVSPSGQYAVVRTNLHTEIPRESKGPWSPYDRLAIVGRHLIMKKDYYYIVRTSDGRRSWLPIDRSAEDVLSWAGDTLYYMAYSDTGEHDRNVSLPTFRMLPWGQPCFNSIPLGKRAGLESPLPSQYKPAIVRYWKAKGGFDHIAFVNISGRHKLSAAISEPVRYLWWQSDTEIGYVDTSGKRHIVDLTKQ